MSSGTNFSVKSNYFSSFIVVGIRKNSLDISQAVPSHVNETL